METPLTPMEKGSITRLEKPRAAAKRPRGCILIVDDEIFVRNAFTLFFETIDFQVATADSAASVRKFLDSGSFPCDVVLLDLVMPGVRNLELLEEIKAKWPDVEVIIATGCGSLSSAVEAMRCGAFDYITKPIVDFEEDLLRVVEDALLQRRSVLRAKERGAIGGRKRERSFRRAHLVLEKLTRLATLTAFWTRNDGAAREEAQPAAGDPISEVLKFLDEELSALAGIILHRHEPNGFRAGASWGDLQPLPFSADWFVNPSLYSSVVKAEMAVFPLDEIHTDGPGISAGLRGKLSMGLHLPLVLEGRHRGAALLFFKGRGNLLRKMDLFGKSHPFILLAPLLASLFLGAFDDRSRPQLSPAGEAPPAGAAS
jgi:FixJ family two-component response regulator